MTVVKNGSRPASVGCCAEDPLGDLGVGTDPGLLVRVGQECLDPLAEPGRARARSARDEDVLGADAVFDQRGEAADQRLRAARAGSTGDE